MWFVACVFALGFALAFRTSSELVARSLFTRSELTKIGTASFVSAIALSFVLPRTRTCAWIAIVVPLSIAVFAAAMAVHRRAKTFRERFGEVLSIVILKMKAGRSFRQSLAEVIADCDPFMRAKLSEIAGSVAFSQQKSRAHSDRFVANLITELSLADRQPHAAMKRLIVLRERLRIEDDFRRKSGQVLARVRVQSSVMGGLYVAIFSFIALKFGWKRNSDLMIASFGFFCAGALWIWFAGRRIKWKV